jgi:hypothetical protein
LALHVPRYFSKLLQRSFYSWDCMEKILNHLFPLFNYSEKFAFFSKFLAYCSGWGWSGPSPNYGGEVPSLQAGVRRLTKGEGEHPILWGSHRGVESADPAQGMRLN